jgi:Right handed beta helix region
MPIFPEAGARQLSRSAITLLSFLLLSASLWAQNTIRVPADQPTIQAGIDAAVNGDTVLVSPGTYVENINFLGKAITVTSSNEADSTIIDGGGTASVVTFITGETSSSVLDGFTLQNGFDPFGDGGAIKIDGASPIVRNNVITRNNGPWMSAIWVRWGSPVIQHNTITGNGQLSANQGSGGRGAAIQLGGSGAQVLDNIIMDNTMMNGLGGALSLSGGTAALISNNVIKRNTAGDGGAIEMNNRANAIFVGNLIVGNIAPTHPGIYAGGAGTSTSFVNNTIADNLAPNQRGAQLAIDFDMSGLTFTNNIIAARGIDPLEFYLFAAPFSE